jgi:hypothetical protein
MIRNIMTEYIGMWHFEEYDYGTCKNVGELERHYEIIKSI